MSEFNLGEPPTTKSLPLKANQNVQNSPPRLRLSIKDSPTQENPPPMANLDSTSPVSGNNDNPHALPDFDGAPLPDDETTEAVPVGEGAAGKITPSGMITYEIFDDGFCKAFQLAGHVSGFQTLVHAPEQPARADATRAIYDIILDTPSLQFLLQPQSLWMQRALAISAFALPVSAGVAAELQAKKAARQPQQEKAADEKTDGTANMRASLKGKKS